MRTCGVPARAVADLGILKTLFADLCAVNERTNLTRITDWDDYWYRHILDSLAVGQVVPELMASSLRVADVGCGAGFPLLVLGWANASLCITGIEPRSRKAAFVRREAEMLGLDNCTVLATQAREAGRLGEHRHAYDVVLLRAVGSVGRMVRECRGLIRPGPGSRLVFYKTPATVCEETRLAEREAAKFGLRATYSEPIQLPAGGARQFIILSSAA